MSTNRASGHEREPPKAQIGVFEMLRFCFDKLKQRQQWRRRHIRNTIESFALALIHTHAHTQTHTHAHERMHMVSYGYLAYTDIGFTASTLLAWLFQRFHTHTSASRKTIRIRIRLRRRSTQKRDEKSSHHGWHCWAKVVSLHFCYALFSHFLSRTLHIFTHLSPTYVLCFYIIYSVAISHKLYNFFYKTWKNKLFEHNNTNNRLDQEFHLRTIWTICGTISSTVCEPAFERWIVYASENWIQFVVNWIIF